MRYIIAAFLTLFVTQAQAQAPTRLCFPTNGANCQEVTASNPFPVAATATITGFSSNNNFGSLTATGSSSASTALPAGGGTAVRISNTGTTAVSCTFATGAATGLVSNIYVNAGSAVVRQVGTYDHIACIDQSGSVSNLVTLEGGSGLGNDSGGGGGSGGGGLSVTDQAAWTQASSSFTPSGGTFNDAATLSSGQQGTFRLTTKRAQIVDVDSTGSQLHTDLTSAIPDCGATPCTNKIGTVYSVSQYPSGATAITASATGTTAATTATLAGVVAKTTYICGYSIRANATAAATVTNTITGVITATLSSIMWIAPLASGIGVDEQIFSPCIPASATNTGIAIVSGAPGSGGTVSSRGWGYQL